MSKAHRKIRITDATPPMNLWRQYPLWEYCLDEEGLPGQHEGTIKPSRAQEWRSRFDHSAGYDLATVFGEATLADGRTLPAELDFGGAPSVGPHARPELLYIYFAPPSVDDADRWSLHFERVIGRWVVPYYPKSIADAADHLRSVERPEFDLSNPKVFPLKVHTFAPRYAGTLYELEIDNNGIAVERNIS
jgi:hypothetical protein